MTLEFWKDLGLTGRFACSSMEELAEIRKRTDAEIEALFTERCGISLGRCTLSNPYEYAELTVVATPILPLKYGSYDMPFGQETAEIHKGEIPEEFSMSAVDMSMIDHIPDMIENEGQS